ncbi:Txe/YoeB family addiction module toxin [Undibacterium sp. Xuan67W]|uniref:Txe/YoeB family addiction module toxin n=1 Tax=Undibacterium sp. Xuan67W TaxID=3413057 RepID=UPI003BF38CD8
MMSRRLCFIDKAWGEYVYWQGQDRKTLKRINTLIEATSREPFEGIGKPKVLLGDMSGFWSRRIDERHRLVYAVDDYDLTILACRYQYGE